MMSHKKFEIIDSTSREEWLEQRKNYITATDVIRLLNPTVENLRYLYEEKHNGGSSFTGNAYTKWGHEREPLIAHAISVAMPNLRLSRNEKLCASTRYPLLASTPDMLSDSYPYVSAQIKTAGAKQFRETIDEFIDAHPNYAAQMEWEMLTIGSDWCVIVVEERLGAPGSFTNGRLIYGTYRSNPELRERLLEGLEKYRQFTPSDTQQDDEDFDLHHLIAQRNEFAKRKSELNAQVKDVTAEIEKIDAQMLEKLGTDPGRHLFGDYQVDVKTPRKTVRFDRKTFAKDHPDLEKQYLTESVGKPTISIKLVEAENDG